MTVFVDTRTILVDSSPRVEMFFGANSSGVAEHLLPVIAGQALHEGTPQHINSIPSPWLHNQSYFQNTYFETYQA
jgi:hypothetical protein